MNDPTENIRRQQVAQINEEPGPREKLEDEYGQVWTTDELGEDFEVIAFLAPYVVVRSRKTGKKGTLMFQARPRFYFGYQEN